MKVKYIKDLSYDSKITWALLGFIDKVSGKDKAKEIGMHNDLYQKLSEAKNYLEIKDDLERFLQEKYSEIKNDFDNIAKAYQKEWNKIGGSFSEKVVQITKKDWFHNVFYVVLSPINKGVNSTGGNKVVRSVFEDAKEQTRITAHEILMSHIWSILFEIYGENAREDKYMYYWALNEVTTTALLGLEDDINNLWLDSHKGFDQFLSNYPKLRDTKSVLKEFYLTRKSFLQYLDKGISWIDNNYGDEPLYTS